MVQQKKKWNYLWKKTNIRQGQLSGILDVYNKLTVWNVTIREPWIIWNRDFFTRFDLFTLCNNNRCGGLATRSIIVMRLEKWWDIAFDLTWSIHSTSPRSMNLFGNFFFLSLLARDIFRNIQHIPSRSFFAVYISDVSSRKNHQCNKKGHRSYVPSLILFLTQSRLEIRERVTRSTVRFATREFPSRKDLQSTPTHFTSEQARNETKKCLKTNGWNKSDAFSRSGLMIVSLNGPLFSPIPFCQRPWPIFSFF